MSRRLVRQRKEYLYRKGLEGKERTVYEKKAAVKRAIEAGKPIPTELRKEEGILQHEIELEDAGTAVLTTHVDDEYAQAGVRDPLVCVTTSRDPSSRLKQFAKELKLIIPNARRVNRGGYQVGGLVEAARKNNFTDMVVVQETRGEPDGLLVCHLPLGPTAYFTLSNTVLRHDIQNGGTMSEAYPHLILDGFSTTLGQRVGDILKFLFPIPKVESQRVITFSNDSDYISFRHHVWEKQTGKKEVTLKEVGPRFEMQLYQIKLGTMDQLEAENEWVLRPYMNSAKRRRYL